MARFCHISLSVLLASCSAREVGSTRQASLRPKVIEVWAHSGQPSERLVLEELVRRFEREPDGVRVDLTVIPEGSYSGQVQAAALAGRLPDVLELDGPFVAHYVWQQKLQPLDALLSQDTKADLLPSIVAQGSLNGSLYAVGMFDSGLGLYGRWAWLRRLGVRIPVHPDEAWTGAEFEDVLRTLAGDDRDGAVLDLKLNYQGEWFSYAFSPAIQSAGGDLLRRQRPPVAEGVLNGGASVALLKKFQSWMRGGLVDANLDDAAFVSGRTPLSWVGHWEFGRYHKAWGADLVVLPLPDFGHGSKTGQGSWAWTVTRRSRASEDAGRFIEFLLRTENVLHMAGANGAVPATRRACEASPLYGPEGPLKLFWTQLAEGYAIPRPKTPAYGVVSSVFERAFRAIRDGFDVASALDRAARAIDQEIADNHGYRGLPE